MAIPCADIRIGCEADSKPLSVTETGRRPLQLSMTAEKRIMHGSLYEMLLLEYHWHQLACIGILRKAVSRTNVCASWSIRQPLSARKLIAESSPIGRASQEWCKNGCLYTRLEPDLSCVLPVGKENSVISCRILSPVIQQICIQSPLGWYKDRPFP